LSLHTPHPPRLTLFPYTTLFRSKELGGLHSQSLVLQFFGSPVRDAQPQPKRPVGRNLSLDCRARPFNRLPVIRPAHARMHVQARSEEHTSELQSRENLVCRLLLE